MTEKNELEIIREWMNDPLPVDDIFAGDLELVVGSETRVRANVHNTTYLYEEADARPVYEEDFGEVEPSHYDVYRNGIDWEIAGDYLCLTGDVEGIPCEAFWSLEEITIDV